MCQRIPHHRDAHPHGVLCSRPYLCVGREGSTYGGLGPPILLSLHPTELYPHLYLLSQSLTATAEPPHARPRSASLMSCKPAGSSPHLQALPSLLQAYFSSCLYAGSSGTPAPTPGPQPPAPLSPAPPPPQIPPRSSSPLSTSSAFLEINLFIQQVRTELLLRTRLQEWSREQNEAPLPCGVYRLNCTAEEKEETRNRYTQNVWNAGKR